MPLLSYCNIILITRTIEIHISTWRKWLIFILNMLVKFAAYSLPLDIVRIRKVLKFSCTHARTSVHSATLHRKLWDRASSLLTENVSHFFLVYPIFKNSTSLFHECLSAFFSSDINSSKIMMIILAKLFAFTRYLKVYSKIVQSTIYLKYITCYR